MDTKSREGQEDLMGSKKFALARSANQGSRQRESLSFVRFACCRER